MPEQEPPASLVAAFVEDLIETARRLAARSPGARLDPPLLLALDEIGNLARCRHCRRSWPKVAAPGSRSTMPVLQSLAQARDRWSEHQAGAIWDASIVKIILGGASNSRDLQDLSTLIGSATYTDSVTLGDHGTRSNQRSIRRVPILPPDRVRTLPFGTGITMLRSAPPSSPTCAPGRPARRRTAPQRPRRTRSTASSPGLSAELGAQSAPA